MLQQGAQGKMTSGKLIFLGTGNPEGIPVPLGAFTGISVLAGFGPEITFRVLQVGSVICSFESEFTSAGINQTVHSIYLDVTSEVSVVLPSGTKKISTVTEVMVAESLIVGEVPDIYWGKDIFSQIKTG